MGTYNYSARELADEIDNLLHELEGDFTPAELGKALEFVAVEHGVQRTVGTRRQKSKSKSKASSVKLAGSPSRR